MSVYIRVVRCECGKAHLAAGIGPITKCTCGRSLWVRMWTHGK